MCADAASIDFPSHHLTTCISEARHCIELASKKMSLEKSVEKEYDPEQYSFLKGF